MKRALVLLFTILFFNLLYADIAVKSFQRLDRDMTARIDAPKRDQNGDVCAIIKVVTPETGFAWESDGLGIIAAEHKTGEYWIYIPHGAGARRLTIKHQLLGVLRDYIYPIPIEKATVYEMVLTTGRVITTVEETIESQWLLIKSEPEDALIYVNDEFITAGEYQNKLKPGRYNYRVEKPLYHTEVGVIEITNEKKELLIQLKPAHGFIKIDAKPENNAQVYIDGKLLTGRTPLTSEPIASGEHTVQVIKEMYQPFAQKLNVADGQTTAITANLQPNFAELNLTAPNNATLYINGEQKGKGNWSGRLSAGVYSVEAQLSKHRSAKQDIEVAAGDKRTINLQPTPIYGSLDIMTTPSGANITIDGKKYGTTPNTVNQLLIGNYTVELSKTGYATVIKEVNITEGKSVMLSETLDSGPQIFTETVAGVNIDMVYIKEGTFMMGSPRNEKDRESDETQHQVSLSGFYMGKYTITVAQFKVFVDEMSYKTDADKGGGSYIWSGSEWTKKNGVNWRSDVNGNTRPQSDYNHPVIHVSWNDAVAYCNWLSRRTSKTYRLPTEAEWEYACRAGTTTPFNTGNNLTTAQANYNGNYPYNNNAKGIYRAKTLAVGSFAPNAWGLYDMHGNVWEWCNDWYGDYSSGSQINPKGPNSGSGRVLRGGSWYFDAWFCRSAFRNSINPDSRINNNGFRVVLVP